MKEGWPRYIVVLCLVLRCTNASAEAGWTDYALVTELTPTIHERFTVKLAQPKHKSGCKDKDTFYQDFVLKGADKMFGVLLEALISKKQVRVYVTGRCNLEGHSEISAVSLVP